MHPTFSTADVLALVAHTGLTPKQFRRWLDAKLIEPVEGGGTQGSHRRFSVMQAVGIVVAAEVFTGEWGCKPEAVGLIVAAFETVTADWLEKQFGQGYTAFVTLHHGKPLLRGRKYDWVDVRAAYRRVIGDGKA